MPPRILVRIRAVISYGLPIIATSRAWAFSSSDLRGINAVADPRPDPLRHFLTGYPLSQPAVPGHFRPSTSGELMPPRIRVPILPSFPTDYCWGIFVPPVWHRCPDPGARPSFGISRGVHRVIQCINGTLEKGYLEGHGRCGGNGKPHPMRTGSLHGPPKRIKSTTHAA